MWIIYLCQVLIVICVSKSEVVDTSIVRAVYLAKFSELISNNDALNDLTDREIFVVREVQRHSR